MTIQTYYEGIQQRHVNGECTSDCRRVGCPTDEAEEEREDDEDHDDEVKVEDDEPYWPTQEEIDR